MSRFWLLAALLVLIAIAMLVVSVVRAQRADGGARWWLTILVLVLSIGSAAALYSRVSNWNAQLPGAAEAAVRTELEQLRQATTENPNDARGWLNLGAIYIQLEQLSQAQLAFDHANQLTQGADADALAGLAESTALLAAASGDATATQRASALFERALKIDPTSGKALFFTGMMAMNSGNLALARERFIAMRAGNLPPQIASALDKQIAALDAQLKPVVVDPSTAIDLELSLDPALAAQAVGKAALFVFVRGAEGGPPLAVKRLPVTLPAHITLSAGDSMIAGNGIKPKQNVNIVARLSGGGTPTAQSGDLYGELQTVVGSKGVRNIVIGRVTP
jgi:cytochrome c-type biogenesis protein CcmH